MAGVHVRLNEKGKEIVEIMFSVWGDYEIERGKYSTVDHVRYIQSGFEYEKILPKQNEKLSTFIFENEYSMLNDFSILLTKIDPDVIVGHDVFSCCLDSIFFRVDSKFAEPYQHFARVVTKKIRSNNHQAQTRQLFAGRLIADTHAFARETEKMEDYALSSLYV